MIKPTMAYPAVVTTLGDMSEVAQVSLIDLYHRAKTGAKFLQVKKEIADEAKTLSAFNTQEADRQNGALDAYPHGGKADFKRLKAYPKPYMLCADGTDHYGDKIRIFAKCINGARANEMVDIMLMTQSL